MGSKTQLWHRLVFTVSALVLITASAGYANAQEAADAIAEAETRVEAAAAAPLPAETLTIAVGRSEPGHLNLISRIATQFNTRSGAGELPDRAMVAVLAVEDSLAAVRAAQAGRADLGFAALETLEQNDEMADLLPDMWKRAVAIEVLTIVTRRTRMVRDPRQLNGLKVELAGDRTDRLTAHMNQALNPHGISMQSGTFISAGDMREADAFVRLCRAEYDVRIDMIIHPMPTFSGDLPCDVRFMSFNNLDVPENPQIGVMRHITPSETYDWLNSDVTSIGAAVALVDPNGDEPSALRAGLVDYLDRLSEIQPGILDSFDAAIWTGQNPPTE